MNICWIVSNRIFFGGGGGKKNMNPSSSMLTAYWFPTLPFHRFPFPNRVPWVTRQVVMWPLCHPSYPTPPTAWCPVPWRRESLPESPAPACPHPPCMRTHHLTASTGEKGINRDGLKLFAKRRNLSKRLWGFQTRCYKTGFKAFGPYTEDVKRNTNTLFWFWWWTTVNPTKTSLTSVYSRPPMCSFINKWRFPYKTRPPFCLNAHDLRRCIETEL